MGVSFITFTRNSRNLIGDVLNHVGDIVDEMIVVDGESTDDTVAIAKDRGAKVFERHPFGYPEPDRMFALKQATQEWALYLDVDEKLCPALKQELRQLLDSARDEVSAMQTLRVDLTPRGSPILGIFFNNQTRIFRRERAVYKGLVHELPRIDGQTIVLPNRYYILHQGLRGLWPKKWTTYARLESLEYEARSFHAPSKIRRLAPFAFLPATLYLLLLEGKDRHFVNLPTLTWTFRFGIYQNLVWTMSLFRNEQERRRAELIHRVGIIKLLGLD
jgi:(heptosyl)LPS beta-1,4-glucosyltransferase